MNVGATPVAEGVDSFGDEDDGDREAVSVLWIPALVRAGDPVAPDFKATVPAAYAISDANVVDAMDWLPVAPSKSAAATQLTAERCASLLVFLFMYDVFLKMNKFL